MNDTAQRNAKRAAEVDFDDVAELGVSAPSRARRGALAFGLSKKLVAFSVAGAVAAATLFTFAFANRGTNLDTSAENPEAAVAVPAAAVAAVEDGFADRTEEVSRNSVRSNLGEAVADENAKERAANMGVAAEDAVKAYTAMTAEERQRLMDEDMKLVDAQSAKLKKEAEEAARRLEEARKAAEAAKNSGSKSGSKSDSKSGEVANSDISDEDIENLSSTGGSMPLKSGYRIGASFGQTGSWSRYHTGQDFPAPVGTPIYAVASGVVLSPTAGGWAGTNVVIRHGNGGSTLYAHMSRKVVSTGQTVKPGQLIGYVGMSGRTFGPHLHMEYYKPGVTPGKVYEASNPMTFLRSLGVR